MKKALLCLKRSFIFAFSFQLRADSVLTTIEIGNGISGGSCRQSGNEQNLCRLTQTNEVVVIDGKTQQSQQASTLGSASAALLPT